MKQIQNAILEICGDLTREEFSTLCCAIYEYRSFLPHHPQMKVICSNVKVSANKPSVSAVSKNLERAVIHLFEEGDLDILGSYQRSWLFERPLPNQFIRTVALQLWDGQVPSTQAG